MILKKGVFGVIIAVAIVTLVFAVFTKEAGEQQNTAPIAEKQAEQSMETVESAETETEAETEAETETSDELEAIGKVEVDKGLFNVTLTVPKDYVGETTQEKLDEAVKEKGYKSATLNSDGSVTYVMTKEQHEEMLVGVRESIDKSLAEMIESGDYPNITNIEHNDDYTDFTITTKNDELDMSEILSVGGFYMYGGMYGIFSGEEVDNIHVDFKNADSGEIISSANSRDMGNSD